MKLEKFHELFRDRPYELRRSLNPDKGKYEWYAFFPGDYYGCRHSGRSESMEEALEECARAMLKTAQGEQQRRTEEAAKANMYLAELSAKLGL